MKQIEEKEWKKNTSNLQMQRHIHLHIEESHKNAKPEAIIYTYLKSWSDSRMPLLQRQLCSPSHLVSYTLRKLRANV